MNSLKKFHIELNENSRLLSEKNTRKLLNFSLGEIEIEIEVSLEIEFSKIETVIVIE